VPWQGFNRADNDLTFWPQLDYYHWTRVANRPRVANRISDNNTPHPSLLVVRIFLEIVSMIWFRFLFIKIGAVEGAGVAYMSNKGVLGIR
jgi:hypothetical protein